MSKKKYSTYLSVNSAAFKWKMWFRSFSYEKLVQRKYIYILRHNNDYKNYIQN